ncbi:MAG: DUF3078 domain-containing protein [Bacteroidetes bacterium]|nr:DUF3078 domain-containing protein [Bacteroidota bacterium]
MKKFLFSISLCAFVLSGVAQEETKTEAAKLQDEADKLKALQADTVKAWKLGGVISVNGQQVSLSNWAAGGNNSISVAGLVNVYAKYKKGKATWDNNLELGYGVIKQGNNKKWWKNDDKIQFSSKYGHQISKNWYATALADFRTQFTNGYNYPNDSIYISKFMAPAYALAALGFDYKPNSHFSAFIAPVTGKFTFVQDDSLAKFGAFGVQKEIRDPNDATVITQHYLKHREEFGAYFKMQYQTKVMENITFQTVLELFSNYLHNPQNVDVNWSTLTTFKVNKFISATLATQLIYDDDVSVTRSSGDKKGTFGPDVQFKQVLAVGFTYKF